jgi:TIR domain
MPTHPKVFISYSWDDEAHKEWVRRLATQLRAGGVDARLDYWHAVPGDQLPEFMEREIRDANYVIIVCTPVYKTKSEARIGGVGYEGGIMSAEFFLKQNHRKFIPVLARGSWAEAAPSWLLGSLCIDLSVVRCAAGYEELKKTLLGVREQAPPLGPLPGRIQATCAQPIR